MIGKVFFADQEVTGASPDHLFRLGLARSYQDPSLFTRMTTLDNGLLPMQDQLGEQLRRAPWHRLCSAQEIEYANSTVEMLERLQLGHQADTQASDLSGGQMKLLELGRTLMGIPRLLLLDEPTAGVAPNLAYTIFEQIAQLRNEGVTFLIVEHRLEILFDFVDSVYVMHLGKVLAHDTPDEIANNRDVREVYFGE
ncbi:ATP-binding cassette domain-containing protein [Chloroflexi bacterium TSY]|nr:ATP-binding cassette domain-containing protein [Chloroflexi bacterium TSY]